MPDWRTIAGPPNRYKPCASGARPDIPVPTKQATLKPRHCRPWNRGWTTMRTVRDPRDRIYAG